MLGSSFDCFLRKCLGREPIHLSRYSDKPEEESTPSELLKETSFAFAELSL